MAMAASPSAVVADSAPKKLVDQREKVLNQVVHGAPINTKIGGKRVQFTYNPFHLALFAFMFGEWGKPAI
jgi:methyl coenzyme M reductase subunit C-like uncharacterized protein (methanogenesis marker protein 7)